MIVAFTMLLVGSLASLAWYRNEVYARIFWALIVLALAVAVGLVGWALGVEYVLLKAVPPCVSTKDYEQLARLAEPLRFDVPKVLFLSGGILFYLVVLRLIKPIVSMCR